MPRLLLSVLLLMSTLAAAREEAVRLAPPQAMFRSSVTLEQFVRGTVRFVLLHEAGHALVDLYGIPVLGREEDAADRFATWWLSPDAQEDGTDAIAAVEWWLASGRASGVDRSGIAWWDEHGVDEQRGFQIICLLYGADAHTMGPLAVRHRLPEERRESCVPESARNAASWRAYLAGNTAQLVHQLDGFLVPVQYAPEVPAELADAERLVRGWRSLEQLADLLHQFRFPEGKAMLRVQGATCGVPNAFWDPRESRIVLCYELVAHVANVGYEAGFR